ncbi:pseudaminic acid cytidylyltransferase [Francisella salimarina]|uniref:pseudaminic acid cytidylyltransferase n=1 Tax=Francisella salimarina TaxID=2599927 RepID=UPI0037525BF1
MRLAVIPARGGSKRIPRKNIKYFREKPIIAHSIQTLLKSNLFDKVIVSTDDTEIADVAKEYGAEVPFIRPKDISDDFATTGDVVKHAIEWYQSKGENIGVVCCLYATAPFVKCEDLINSLKVLETDDTECVFSATEFSYPIFRSFALDCDYRPEMFWPENFAKRSQDLPKAYHDAGMFYIAKPCVFTEGKPLFSEHSKVNLIPHYRVQDIDTLEDWKRAELMYGALKSSGEI